MDERVDPMVAVVADWFEHDVDLDLLLIVIPDRRVFQLVIKYSRRSDALETVDKAPEIFEWKEVTSAITGEPSPRLTTAFAILEQ
jgi:hypothetical protein